MPHALSLTDNIGKLSVWEHRGPHGYADMNISMDISMNITYMSTMFFSWIISMNISVLLKFHGYEYGYAPNIHEYSWI